jgi:toxin HigB-1
VIPNEGKLKVLSTFRSRALRRYWEKGDPSGLNPKHLAKIDRILGALELARQVEDMNVPGYKLHKLSGENLERWSVWVNGNWRITFSFHDGEAFAIDYEDYH